MRTKKLLFLIIAALATAACDASVLDPSAAVASVSVTPGDTMLVIGSSGQMRASIRTADGTVLHGAEVTWQSTDPTVATVSAAGMVSAVKVGTTQVRASAGGRTGEAVVLVATPEVASMELDRLSLDLIEGDEVQLTATPRDAQGNPIAGLGIQWSASLQDVASVGALGRVTAVRDGTATITAKVHGVSATLTVTVTASQAYDLLYATREDSGVQLFRLGLGGAAKEAPLRLLSLEPLSEQPRLSPDGTRVAFQCMSGFGDRSICVANRDGSERALIVWGLGEWYGGARWNHDGTRLVFFHSRYEGEAGPERQRIGVVDADGSDLVILTANMSDDQHEPVWSPILGDGSERIGFTSGTNTARSVWTMRADGSDRRQVTAATDAFDAAPDWSPDGQTLAFQRAGTAGFDLRLVDADGGNDRALGIARPGNQVAPAWSPDGRLVAFSSNHGANTAGDPSYQIYTVWADGSKLARRTWDDVEKFSPAWRRH